MRNSSQESFIAGVDDRRTTVDAIEPILLLTGDQPCSETKRQHFS